LGFIVDKENQQQRGFLGFSGIMYNIKENRIRAGLKPLTLSNPKNQENQKTFPLEVFLYNEKPQYNQKKIDEVKTCQ
jgi:hypothetical protein